MELKCIYVNIHTKHPNAVYNIAKQLMGNGNHVLSNKRSNHLTHRSDLGYIECRGSSEGFHHSNQRRHVFQATQVVQRLCQSTQDRST